MANNRMYLKNSETGEAVFIAKYYPSTGWYVANENLVKELNALFDKEGKYPERNSMFGANWALELETSESEIKS